MKLLITGSNGFVAKNLISSLKYQEDTELLLYNRSNTNDDLKRYCQEADFVIHLAGVNRSESSDDFYDTNKGLTELIIDYLEEANNLVPILLSSSIQAELDNVYGKSKKAGEDLIINYSKKNNVPVYIYQLENLFGKWSRPFYNSVVATWCHSIARDEEIVVNDENYEITLLYIDDLVKDIIEKINLEERTFETYYQVSPTYKTTLGIIRDTLYEFKENRKSLYIADMSDELTLKLYSTYLSYLPTDDFSYPLLTHSDSRGSFTELLKAKSFGQVSVNVSAPFEVKGEHWHHSKNEKFIVLKGKASIKFRNIYSDEVIEYIVSDKKFEVVDIPTGYTHNIANLLDEDLVTLMWVNEVFDPSDSDTHFDLVEEKK